MTPKVLHFSTRMLEHVGLLRSHGETVKEVLIFRILSCYYSSVIGKLKPVDRINKSKEKTKLAIFFCFYMLNKSACRKKCNVKKCPCKCVNVTPIPQTNVMDMTWDGVVDLNQIMDHKIGTQ